MCGASEKPMMMSGPAPEFEVTAVCWLMSSQPTKSTLTGTPVFSVNRAALARNTSSSGCTNRTGRSMRKVAPFSIGSAGAGTSAALTLDAAVCAFAPPVASAAAATPSASASRRVSSLLMVLSLCLLVSWVPGVESPVNSFHPGLAIGTALHADRLPAAKRGILQHRGVDAAHRPQALQHQRQFIADPALARLVEARRGRGDVRGQ